MKGVDLVVSDEYADVVVGEVYDSSAEAYDYIAHAIPWLTEHGVEVDEREPGGFPD